MAKKKVVVRPNRDPDHYSKRDVPYWWAPEWIRGTSADAKGVSQEYVEEYSDPADCIKDDAGGWVIPCTSYGRIHAVKKNGDVELYMKAKDGNLSYIQGSIQKEFKRWHEDRSIDYLLLGMDPDEIIASED